MRSLVMACTLVAAALLAAPRWVNAVPLEPADPGARPSKPAAVAPAQKASTGKSTRKKGHKPKRARAQKSSALPAADPGYRAAYTAIYRQGDFALGLARLHALRRDGDPDVANLIGYANRKLGRYDDAKYWYEKALAADPRHARTLAYYGMWHAEQGNLRKAADYLGALAAVCGKTCAEYTQLKAAIAGTATY